MQLTQSVFSAGGIYKKYASRLEKLGIITFADFLYHVPHRYEDFSQLKSISSIEIGEVVTVKGTVLSIKNAYTRFHKTIQKAIITDATGTIEATWFNQPYLAKTIQTNAEIVLSGRAERFGNKITMQSPEYELINDQQSETIHTGRLVPIYPETKGISSKWLRRQVFKLLHEYKQIIADPLPKNIKQQFNFADLADALEQIHFPLNYEEALRAKERLGFDELFYLQLQSLHRRMLWRQQKQTTALIVAKHTQKIDTLIASLPFSLTNAQQRAVEHILQDLQTDKPMNRLLQGDVGSGKTIVAAIAMYVAVLNNKQAVLLAPTEILAQQHYTSIKRLLEPFGVKINLVTGSTKGIKNNELGIKNKNILPNSSSIVPNSNIFIGTHALLYKKAEFSNAGLIVVDEQQRFGVEQRGLIREKGNNPHVLTMTATPIPRTMAMTIYGDLDVSYLDEMPVGRKQIRTWLVPPVKRDSAYEWMRAQITTTKSQAFIICPFIEESENMQTVKAAAVEFERLKTDVFPDLKLGLLHGKMKAKEKDETLLQFKNKVFDILVATPVVEVGIDIPNATIIVIEASERFGLSQLHQLRGRVGRGDKQSYCLLFTEAKNPETIKRLKAMETTHSGAKLAELDLHLRGAGDLYGTLQSGYRMLKIASFGDTALIEKAREAARQVYQQLSSYPEIQGKLDEITKQKVTQD